MKNEEIVSAVERYNTPLFLYSEEKIVEHIHMLKRALYPGTKLFYAMKSNPLIGIVKLMHTNGCGIETASKGEIMTALRAGIDPKDIIFTSPGKTVDELTYAIKTNIKLINVESLQEAEILNDLAEKADRKVKIGLRINQNENYSKAKMKMTGVSSQFGIEENDFNSEFYLKLSKLKYIEVVGIQVYSGTQVLDAGEILHNAEYVIKMALGLSEQFSFPLQYLNLGGGFGVPYFKGEKPMDLKILKDGMESLKKRYGERLKDTEIIFESGRFLVAESGQFITKILYRKVSKDTLYYICDGGSNFHVSTAFLGRFVRNNFPIFSIPDNHEKKLVNVVGPLCTPADLIGQKIELSGELNPGDLIVVDKSGAYGLSFSPYAFLSHESPIEVLKKKENYVVLRERGAVEDLWKRQKGDIYEGV